jgi:hypothetical protein
MIPARFSAKIMLKKTGLHLPQSRKPRNLAAVPSLVRLPNTLIELFSTLDRPRQPGYRLAADHKK